MTVLTLTSNVVLAVGGSRTREPMLCLLRIGIARKNACALLSDFGLSSAEFIRRYENDELPETLTLAEWVGEVRMLARLQEKAETLQEIRVAD